jgi:importin subunit beta-1
VAAIAQVELPAGKWQELIPQLLQFSQSLENATLRVHTLQTIGYICEGIVSSHQRSS